jgi:hypothetical protein
MAKTTVKKGTWTKADLQLLKKMFANASTAEVAKKLGRGLEPVKKKASRMGLVKSKKYMKSLGRP